MKKVIGLFIVSFLCIALLNGCAKADTPVWEIPQKVVMIDGTLYYCTDQHIELLRCGVMDGKITKTVKGNELPAENDVSNFGKGYKYQIAGENHIDIVMENSWIRFCSGNCTDDHSQTLTEELYSQQVGNFVPDYDTEQYDGIPITVNPGGPCLIAHISDCPTGGCITQDNAACVKTDNEICICGYPLKENIKTFPGHIRIVE